MLKSIFGTLALFRNFSSHHLLSWRRYLQSSSDFSMASSATALPHRPWCLFCDTWNLPIECLQTAPSLVSVTAMAC
ncbi:hypothetical protein MRX96_041493 [Rhipicephalus microplus]